MEGPNYIVDHDAEAHGADPNQVNPLEIVLHALARFPFTVAVITGLGVAGGVAFALSQPNIYTSVGTLLVRMGALEQQTAATVVDPNWQAGSGGSATGDELLMLTDPALWPLVVDAVGAKIILEPYDPTADDDETTPSLTRTLHELQAWLMQPDPELVSALQRPITPGLFDTAVDELGKRAAVTNPPRTNTLIVAYSATDPLIAQTVTAAYMRVLQVRHREFFEIESEFSFVSERLEVANAAAATARNALNEERKRTGIYNLPAVQAALAGETQALEQQSRQDEILTQSLQHQLTVLDQQILDTPSTVTLGDGDGDGTGDGDGATDGADSRDGQNADGSDGQATTGGSSGVATTDGGAAGHAQPVNQHAINRLVAELQVLNGQVAALHTTYSTSSDYYQRENRRLENRIELVESELLAMRPVDSTGAPVPVVAGTTNAPLQPVRQINPVHTALLTQRNALALQIQALGATIAAREGLLATNRTRIDELMILEPTDTRLTSAVAQTAQAAQALQLAHTRSATLQLIDSDERMGNLLISREASLPVKKDGPQRIKFVLMGLFAGATVGFSIAVARQLLDKRFRYPAEVERALGVPVIGVIPEQRKWVRTGHKLQRTMGEQP